MTRLKDEITIVENIVVSFDMCSSSTIIEDLTLTNSVKAMRDILIKMNVFIREKSSEFGFIRYKFTGDGWILLFPIDVYIPDLIDFLTQLSRYFKIQFTNRVLAILDKVPDIVGLTFGLDSGPLVRVIMGGKREYIGRPLNVACRLQNSIKDRDTSPQYKVLMSRHVFTPFSNELLEYRPMKVSRSLRNIRDGERFNCIKLHLPIIRKKKKKKKKRKI